MTDFQEMFNNAEVPETPQYAPFVKGTYTAQITDAAVDLIAEPNKVQFEFVITSGEYTNRKVWKHYQLSPERVAWLKKDMMALAVDTTGLTDTMALGEKLTGLIGSHAEIFVNPKPNPNDPSKPYNNVYINKPLPADFNGSENVPF